MSHAIYESLAEHRLVPVIALDDVAQASPLADALVAGGLPVAEVTFRTPAALESIRTMAQRGDLLVGAGTVLTTTQVSQAQAAGAKFLVSPGFNPRVVSHALSIGMPICPGVCTPSDVEQAIEHGLEVVKFFPAEAFGGLSTLKAIAAPYRQMRFIPTGGIGPGNVMDYLAFDRVVACGGSWMVKPSLYADGDFSGVETAVREAVQLVGK
ncbi:bifunctional 4-hydroxy-2-oxoglutarate aldolase/2-dehydro-3-deoxy-phosphogluconate aldolase [Aeoliella sp. ICT_H6.2]|uniref:2-dehydro-3-deoxy-phosphogluconate aldolase n=1 Tax=Aeoliella straminimaris TaxID=2954799 RepID=A0A9X2FCC8_9BACT|nr:bifunctional 4-hydroxy-2-oxoglutarate aldolase/2-dehydro-3-deoxy-phosphogluconate aldolase [Aeoliella straminimaris]MCO6046427.1 bifunctional 4-hydroxy-2-oxoglutarate aldolase/2-dehydro-3-deoxy-phosphogluconate aldolase [Aeoliella straminimaris]